MSSLCRKWEALVKGSSDPVVNKSMAKTMQLPKFPVSMEEHLNEWATFLEEGNKENEVHESMIRKFRDLVYSRKGRMQGMLQSGADLRSSISCEGSCRIG